MVPEDLALFDEELMTSKGDSASNHFHPHSQRRLNVIKATHVAAPTAMRVCTRVKPICGSPAGSYSLYIRFAKSMQDNHGADHHRRPGCMGIDAVHCRLSAALEEEAAPFLGPQHAQGAAVHPGPCLDLRHVPVPGQYEHLRLGRGSEVRLVPTSGRAAAAVHDERQVSRAEHFRIKLSMSYDFGGRASGQVVFILVLGIAAQRGCRVYHPVHQIFFSCHHVYLWSFSCIQRMIVHSACDALLLNVLIQLSCAAGRGIHISVILRLGMRSSYLQPKELLID